MAGFALVMHERRRVLFFPVVVLLLVCGMASASARALTAPVRSYAPPNKIEFAAYPVGNDGLPPNPRNGLFVANNPINAIDPLGLLVEGYFNVQQGILTVRDVDTGESVTMRADSGVRGTEKNNNPNFESMKGGPTPRGQYELFDRIMNVEGSEDWNDLDNMQKAGVGVWALDMMDKNPRDDKGAGRGTIRLHPGWGTGCVVSDDAKGWGKLRKIMESTKTQTTTDALGRTRTKYGTINVFSSASPQAMIP